MRHLMFSEVIIRYETFAALIANAVPQADVNVHRVLT